MTLDEKTLIAFGDNSYFQCGYPKDEIYSPHIVFNFNNSVKQIKCGMDFSIVLLLNGSVYVCGNNQHGQIGMGKIRMIKEWTRINGLEHITRVACGCRHSCFVKSKKYCHTNIMNR